LTAAWEHKQCSLHTTITNSAVLK